MATVPVDPLPTKPASGTLADATEVKSKFDTLFAYLAGAQAESDLFKPGAGIYDSYRNILKGAGSGNPSLTAATWYFQEGGGLNPAGAVGSALPAVLLHLVAADFAVSQKTSKLRLRAQLVQNSVAPGCNFVVALHPLLSTGGGGGSIIYTLGSAVSGSSVTFTAPAASSLNNGNSGDFNLPADGLYVLAVTPTGAPIASSYMNFYAQLQVRAV